MEENKPLERYEEGFIRMLRQASGRPVDTPTSPELEALIGDLGEVREQGGIYVNPRIIENYARTQREADRLNRELGLSEEAGDKDLWYGCLCGRLHRADKNGNVDTGWY